MYSCYHHFLLYDPPGHLADRYNKTLGWFEGLLLAAGVVRLIILAFPQNQWESLIPPYNWSLLRNGFLVVQGLGVMFLILRDAARRRMLPSG